MFKTAVAIALVASAFWVMGNRQNPADMTQEGWHHLATSTRDGIVHPLPRVHEVVVEPLDRSPAEVVLGYLLPSESNAATVEGLYDPTTGDIHIVGELSRLQATMPVIFQGTFRQTLRHEYGHAYLDDWAKEHGMASYDPALVDASTRGAEIDPEQFPEELRPVIEAYEDAPDGIYGMAYFNTTFHEFFAESYARYVGGQHVPAAVKAFFDDGVKPVERVDDE
ncbi:MAG: hypothetical protein HY876_04480 [Coriobacteriales bacterium]|nr:hypothetical protein [Coriobacteriales bacterium]